MTDFTINTLHQPIEISDSLFKDHLLPFCTLCIEIDARFIRICVIEDISRQCKWLASYPFDSIQGVNDLLLALQDRIANHPIFSQKQWGNIIISFHSEIFTYVPAPLFEQEQRARYIALMVPQQVYADETIFDDQLRIIDAHAVYVAPPTIIDWFIKYYADRTIRFCHYTQAMIYHTITENYATIDSTRMSILVNQSQLTIVVVEGPRLIYCNTFAFQTVNELTYFTLAVVQQLKLSQETVRLVLHGDVCDGDAIHTELARFIELIEVGRKPQTLSYPHEINRLETQWYNSLFHTYFMVF